MKKKKRCLVLLLFAALLVGSMLFLIAQIHEIFVGFKRGLESTVPYVDKTALFEIVSANRDTLLDAAHDIVKTNVELNHLVKTILNSPSLLGEYNIKPYSFTGYGSAAECLSMYSQFVGGFQIHFSQLERFQATVKSVMNNEGIPL